MIFQKKSSFFRSLKQTTPGSVPSCQMQQSQTPDQQIAFMSPQMQQQG